MIVPPLLAIIGPLLTTTPLVVSFSFLCASPILPSRDGAIARPPSRRWSPNSTSRPYHVVEPQGRYFNARESPNGPSRRHPLPPSGISSAHQNDDGRRRRRRRANDEYYERRTTGRKCNCSGQPEPAASCQQQHERSRRIIVPANGQGRYGHSRTAVLMDSCSSSFRPGHGNSRAARPYREMLRKHSRQSPALCRNDCSQNVVRGWFVNNCSAVVPMKEWCCFRDDHTTVD
jgi:hypothetical protein